jgi:alkylation response protein AidB-like acyl-CoA dehydrogenase
MLGFHPERGTGSARAAVRDQQRAPHRGRGARAHEDLPLDLFRELGWLGYLGVGYPEEHGGSGGDMPVMRRLLVEEIAG